MKTRQPNPDPFARERAGLGRLGRTVAAVALMLAVLMQAAVGQQGQTVRVSDGVTAVVPVTLTVKQGPQGVALTDEGQTFVVAITSHDYANFEAFAQDAHLEKDGLQPVGEVQSLGGKDRCFRAWRATEEGNVVVDTFVRFSPYGGGVVVAAFAKEANAPAAYAQGLAVARSVAFQARSQTASANPWQAALSGSHLLYLYTGNGYSERKDLYLLPSGVFSARSDASSLSVNGSGAVAGGGDGTWRVTPDGRLILQYSDGDSSSYTLARGAAGNEILLNGKRWFITRD